MVDIVEKPLPTPRAGQSQSKFISSCMGNATMKKEFPDMKQRSAVCYSQWKKKGNKAEDYQTVSGQQDFVPDATIRSKEKYEVDDIVIYDGKVGKIIKVID